MMFLGLTDAAGAERLASLRVAEATFTTRLAGRGLAAVGANAPAATWLARSVGGRLNALQGLVSRQRLLEALAERGPIVATAGDAEVADLDEAVAALGPDLAPFEAALARFGLKREYQLLVAWDAQATLKAVAGRPEVGLAAARAEGRRRFGEALSAAMEAERRRLVGICLGEFAAAVEDLIALPTSEADLVVNALALVAPDGGARLDAALARVDAALPGEPRVRCLGPLPATSFAAIEFQRADARALGEARVLLDLGPSVSSEELKAAFRLKSKLWHPDAGGDAQRFAKLISARALLASFADRNGADAIATLRLGGRQELAA